MPTYGAVPEQLTALGRNLQQQITSIDSIIATVTSALSSTTWTGPARDQFESDWNTIFKTALGRLGQAFDAAGNDCVSMSDNLQLLMGARPR